MNRTTCPLEESRYHPDDVFTDLDAVAAAVDRTQRSATWVSPRLERRPCGCHCDRSRRPDSFALMCIEANPIVAARIVIERSDPARFLDKLGSELSKSTAHLRLLVS